MKDAVHLARAQLEALIMSHIKPRSTSLEPAEYKPACMTPGCSVNCSFGYSCHNQRLGRGPVIAWPVVTLAGLIVALLIV